MPMNGERSGPDLLLSGLLHSVDDVVLTHSAGNLHPYRLPRLGVRDLLVFNFYRVNCLLYVRCCSSNDYFISLIQLGREFHYCDTRFRVEVRNHAHFLILGFQIHLDQT